jgi:hypothetical protein
LVGSRYPCLTSARNARQVSALNAEQPRHGSSNHVHPADQSLGVVTFSEAQAVAIETALRDAWRNRR